MRVCIFDDGRTSQLEPLTLTRPACDLLCGLSSLLDKQCRRFGATETGLLLRPSLVDLARRDHPFAHVNDLFWLHSATTVLVNSRWLPPPGLAEIPLTPHLGLCQGQVAYAALPPQLLTYFSPNTIDDCLEMWKQTVATREAGGAMIDFPWHLIEHNAGQIVQDFPWRTCALDHGYFHPANLTILGDEELLSVHPTAEIEPWVVADTRNGPVVVDREARIRSFTRLEGPCYVGPQCAIAGATIRGSSIGPVCRIRGEVEASIFQGHANKQHDGFIGHSFIGSWVNVAAGVNTADLRLDYQPIRMTIGDREQETGCRKVGSFIGDHAKIGLNCQLDAGSLIGAFAVLLPGPGLQPRQVPSFCMTARGEVLVNDSLTQHLATAAEVMRRRDWVFTPVHEALYRAVHQATAPVRQALLRQQVKAGWRRSA